MKYVFLLIIQFFLWGCNSKEPALTSIEGIRDPSDTIPYITSISAQGPGTYLVGAGLTFDVAYSEIVIVDGSPRIAINADSGVYYGYYISGSGTDTLSFQFVVPAGAYDYNGIQLSGVMNMNGGSIYDPDDDDDALLTYTAPSTSGVLLNGIDPVITSITADNGNYKIGATVSFTVNYSYPVYVTGNPKFQIGVGGSTEYATYVSGSGTTALRFDYAVTAAEEYAGARVYGPILPNGGSIEDFFTDTANYTFATKTFASVLIDGIAPYETLRVAPVNAPTRTSSTYIDYAIHLNEIINITGTPRIQITIGSATKYADYISGSGGSSLYFRYEVVTGDTDADGIVSAVALDLNGGTIKDRLGNPKSIVELSWPAHTVLVSGTAPATLTSSTPPSAGTYKIGDVLTFTMNFDQSIDVQNGTPHLDITIGGTPQSAVWDSASDNSTSIVFKYTVVQGDEDTDGITIGGISYNSSSFMSAGGAVSPTNSWPAGAIIVDGIRPTITAIATPGGNYKIDDEVPFTVTFSEPVDVTGFPILQLKVGSPTRNALYYSGSGTTDPVFRYHAYEGYSDSDGVNTLSPMLPSSGSIKDLAGNDATLTFVGANYASTIIDAVRPTFTVTPPAGIAVTVWRPGNTMGFTVTASENINVTGTPYIQLNVGGTTKQADLSSTGATSMSFSYTTGAYDLDMDGISLGNSSLVMNGGSVTDSFGNAANPALGSPALSTVYVLPTEIKHWFDANDTYTTTSTTTATTMKSKASGFTLGASAAAPSLVTNPAQNTKYIQFTGASYYTITGAFDVVIMALKTPTSSGNAWRETSSAFNNQKIMYSPGIPNQVFTGANCTSTCEFFTPPNSMATVDGFGTLSPYTWTTGQYRTIAVDFKDPPSQSYHFGEFNGQIGELIILESGSTVPTSLIESIGTYLNTKHGSSW